MAQYQSFPDTPGDSLTLEKLRGLRLPSLLGKRFLDVGCNEGFFCGYALWDGARQAVGIDQNAAFIAKARQRFPRCEFLQQSWDSLPQGPFDVILLASALHYANDQPALISALMSRLQTDGVLVLELGVHPSLGNEWIKVKRGIDERSFPTMSKLQEVLRNHAWKYIGPSVAQQGDPVPRFVMHVKRRRPVAYLLMQPPGYGKSSIARSLFQPALIQVVSGDRTIDLVARGKLSADEALQNIIRQDYSSDRIDQVTQLIFKSGLVNSYVTLMAQQTGAVDFALDAYVPVAHHAAVTESFAEKGYMPVRLVWEQMGTPEASVKHAHERAEAYLAALSRPDQGFEIRQPTKSIPFKGPRVYIDEIIYRNGQLAVRGWALNEVGVAPSMLVLEVAGTRHVFSHYDKHVRPDVQNHFLLAHAGCGYVLSVRIENTGIQDLKEQVSVFAGESLQCLAGPFRK
jgi:SAM-dependent methyltransferase